MAVNTGCQGHGKPGNFREFRCKGEVKELKKNRTRKVIEFCFVEFIFGQSERTNFFWEGGGGGGEHA